MTPHAQSRPSGLLRRADFAVVLWMACSMVGCGDSSEVQLVPVSGTVLLDGQLLTKGRISTKTTSGRGGRSKIDTAGRFVLGTHQDGDGAQLGVHKVAVVAYEMEGGGNSIEAPVKSLVPERYSRADGSGIEIEVKPGGIKDITIELTSP